MNDYLIIFCIGMIGGLGASLIYDFPKIDCSFTSCSMLVGGSVAVITQYLLNINKNSGKKDKKS